MTDILAALAAPFDPTVVSWRVGSVSKGDGTKPPRGMALAYLDSRDVQDRLTAVVGLDWQVRHPWSCGTKLACEIGLKIDGEWIWRGDGAGDSDVEAEKGAFSDSFKRAAVRWGIGRYLYDVQSPWVTVEPAGKSWRIPEAELRRLASVLPRPAGARPQTAAANGATHPANTAGSPAPTERAAQNSPTGHGPTATTHASPSEADPFAPEPPKRVDHPRRQEALDAFTRIKKSIEAARLPRVIDDIAKVNTADLALIKEVHAESYNLLMQMMTARKGEMLAAA